MMLSTDHNVRRKALQRFLVIIMLPTIGVMLPFWVFELDGMLLGLITPLWMWLPSLAALITMNTVVRPASRRAFLAITPLRPVRRVLAGAAAIVAGTSAVIVATLLLSHSAGFIQLDLVEWRGYRGDDLSITPSAAQQQIMFALALMPLYILGYMLLTTGEELGWRGFLHTLLRPQGFWITALSTSAIWTVWHIPLIATSVYQGDIPMQQALATLGNLAVVSLVISALRERSGSVWPAAFGHAMLNTVVLFGLSAFHVPLPADNQVGFWGFTITNWLCWSAALIFVLPRQMRSAPTPTTYA